AYDRPHQATSVNPLLIASKVADARPDPDEEREGCLSVPGLVFPLKRADRVTVNGVDEAGRPVTLSAQGWFARILQHEYDHLQGILYVDRLDKRRSRKWKKAKAGHG